MQTVPRLRFRSIWLSDLHLGTRGAKTEFLIDFLRATEAEHLFLVGDVVDGWSLTRSWFWSATTSEVVHLVLAKARAGTRVTYVPGNHDEAFRDYAGHVLGGIVVAREAVHRTADGRRFLVVHGDQFDAVVQCARWLAILGDQAYQASLVVNTWLNRLRRRLGYRYWSLSAWLKHRVKAAVSYVTRFEEAVAAEARRRGVDGVICGHIHTPEIRDIGGVLYCNDGDWVESCTALVEHGDGRLEILRWTDEPDLPVAAAAAVPAPLAEEAPEAA